MPPVQKQSYKSPSQPHGANNTLRFHGWVPVYGPSGGINVIDELEVLYEGTDYTLSVAATEGEDTWRALERLVIEQVDGAQRCNLQGDEVRHYAYYAMGADRVREHADLAIATNGTFEFSFLFPFEQRYAQRPKEYSLPAELLKEVRVTCAKTDATGLAVGGGTLAIDGAAISVVAHCHEEFAVPLKVAMSVTSSPFPSTSGITLKVGGRLRDLLVVARGAAGGASMANFTEVRIDGLMPEPLRRSPDLLQPYLRSRGAATNDANAADGSAVHNDPAAAGKSVPIFYGDEDTSSFDPPLVDEVMLRATNSVASCNAITGVILPQSPQVKRALEARHGVAPGEWRIKTVSKTNRNPANWKPEKAAFIEWTAPLKRRGLIR